MINCILMDLDGTLVDFCDHHYNALNWALKDVCGYEISRKDHINKYNALTTRQKIEILSKEGVIKHKSSEDQVFELKQKYTNDLLQKLSVDWQKVEMCQRLYEDGYILGCVTNAIRNTVEVALKKIGIIEYMSLVVSNEDVEINKPDPYPYVYAMGSMEVRPIETLIIEDSPKGICSALDSEAYVMQVRDPTEVTYKNIRQCIKNLALNSPERLSKVA